MDCFHPQEIRLPDGRYQLVRCNRCLACLAHRQAEWITRLRIELEEHPTSSYFVTLTYDDDHIPKNPGIVDGEFSKYPVIPTVRKEDVMTFHADLRKRFQQGFFNSTALGYPVRMDLPDTHFRYYVTSEYGPQGLRPHYHGFYVGLPEDPHLTFDLFNEIWHRGFTYCEPAQSDKAAAYVAKYLVNTSLVPIPDHADRPFALMSKGLGSSYLDTSLVEWHRQDPVHRAYVPHQGARQILPRYLRDKIFDDAMKEDLLAETVERQYNQDDMIYSMTQEERDEYFDQLEQKQKEAVRQAEWRFRKKGKIK